MADSGLLRSMDNPLPSDLEGGFDVMEVVRMLTRMERDRCSFLFAEEEKSAGPS